MCSQHDNGFPSSKGTRRQLGNATIEAAAVRYLCQSLWEGHSKGQGWQRDKGQQDRLKVNCMLQRSCKNPLVLESHSISLLQAQHQ